MPDVRALVPVATLAMMAQARFFERPKKTAAMAEKAVQRMRTGRRPKTSDKIPHTLLLKKAPPK